MGFSELDSIAHGMETKIYEVFGISRLIREKTTEVDKELWISEGIIKQWVENRSMHKDNIFQSIDLTTKHDMPSLLTKATMSMMKFLLELPEHSKW